MIHPCKNCITAPICKAIPCQGIILTYTLFKKCSLLRKYFKEVNYEFYKAFVEYDK